MDLSFDGSEVEALFDRVRAADGRSPGGPPDPAASDVHVERDAATGELTALAWRPRGAGVDPAELYVDPRFRGRGIGRRLAAALLREPGGIWAHSTLPAAAHLAAELGAAPTRELLQLRRSLSTADLGAQPDPIPNVVDPAGFSIRTFTPGADDAEFLRVNAAAFQWHPEQGRLDQRGLDSEIAEPWFDADGFFLAVPSGDGASGAVPSVDGASGGGAPGGTVLGFHWTKVHPAGTDDSEAIGEIYVLAVDPASPVRHLGGVLTAAGLKHLASKGLKQVMLYVESDNEPALKLYRRFGFTEHIRDTVFSR